MILKLKLYHIVVSLILFYAACNSDTQNNDRPKAEPTIQVSENFKKYWYRGMAEISGFELRQARYGEIRKGSQILLFVTEDFSKTQHQKLENPTSHSDDAVKVLKMNSTKSFITGVYEYNMMNSVFTPVELTEKENTIRSTTSSQEWCGHTFTLIDLRDNNFDVELHSYFISEGDTQFIIERAYLEDGLYNRIRINPDMLPLGTIQMIPGSFYQRFKHIDIKAFKAEAELIKNDSINDYKVFYPELDKSLSIKFGRGYPYLIEEIIEEYKDGNKMLKTVATRKSTIMSDYWNKNAVIDTILRKALF